MLYIKKPRNVFSLLVALIKFGLQEQKQHKCNFLIIIKGRSYYTQIINSFLSTTCGKQTLN